MSSFWQYFDGQMAIFRRVSRVSWLLDTETYTQVNLLTDLWSSAASRAAWVNLTSQSA